MVPVAQDTVGVFFVRHVEFQVQAIGRLVQRFPPLLMCTCGHSKNHITELLCLSGYKQLFLEPKVLAATPTQQSGLKVVRQ